VEKWRYLWLFQVGHMRNINIKDVRSAWKESALLPFQTKILLMIQNRTGRLFFGRVRVMALAIGNTPEREYSPGLHKISKHLHGQVGLFFTSWDTQETLDYFHSVQMPDFARSGNIAPREVQVPSGPLSPIVPEEDQAEGYKPTPFPASMEPHLRQLGLNTRLEKGIVTMSVAQTICKKGDVLTTEQAHILKLLGVKLSTFRIALRWRWDKDTGAVEEYDPPLEDLGDDMEPKEDGEEDDDNDDMEG
jgi:mRNA turnover protein 4